MSFDQIAAFIVFAVTTSITPGPNNVMLTATGANVGMRRGIPHLLGVSLGFSLMMFVVAAGIGGALLANPALIAALRWIGIAVLLWLALRIAMAGRAVPGKRERPIGFLQAAAFQWVNPKAWLMCVGVVSQFLQPGGPSPFLQAALFALLFVIAGAPCSAVWLAFGAAMQRFLRTDRALRVFNMTMGLTLAATVFLLV